MAIGNVTLEGVRITFRNFSGKADRYTREGDRSFAVLLDEPELVKALVQDGWNVKRLKAREPGDEEQAYLTVKVKIGGGGRPVRIVLVTERGQTNLDEDSVGILDWADVISADMIIRAYEWERDGDKGVTAYLNSLYLNIREDDLERKYATIPHAGIEAEPTF